MTDFTKPIFFKSNRVRRIYTGGKLFAEFFGDNSTDGFYPEEWLCSSTKALNLGNTDPYEGISQTEEGEYFSELLAQSKKEMLGEREELGILCKILDSAIRLPVQTHPDKEFSLKYFGSTHGKAESWVVLATRENAAIYLGFKEKISKEIFKDALQKGDDALLPLLNRIPVKAGDVFFIPGKAVHAIGAGCLIMETQEPTDFTIQPEATCGDYILTDYEKYLGLDPEIAFDCFDMDFLGDKAEKICRKIPKITKEKQSLITAEDTPCFSVNRYSLKSEDSEKLKGVAIYVVTSGSGVISGPDFEREIEKGDYFFMPKSAENKFKFKTENELEVIQCLPPEIV